MQHLEDCKSKYIRPSGWLLGLVILLLTSTADAGLFDKKKKQQDPGDWNNRIFEQLPEAAKNASYSGTRTMNLEGQVLQSKIYNAGPNQRSEMNMQGMQIISIIRAREGMIYSLMPQYNQYMKINMDEARSEGEGGAAAQPDFRIEEIGPETIDGVMTTRYHIPETTQDDVTFKADYWITAQGVPLKTHMIGKSGKRKKDKFDITVTMDDVVNGPQDPELFEIPDGYTEMSGFSPSGDGFMADITKQMGQGAKEGANETARTESRRKVGKILRDIID